MTVDYSFYMGLTNDARCARALRGLETGDLQVRNFHAESHRLAATVHSSSSEHYDVSIGWDGLSCECPDFRYRCADHKMPCKHLLALMFADQGGFQLRHGDERVDVHPVHDTYAEDRWGIGYHKERDFWRDTAQHKLWLMVA